MAVVMGVDKTGRFNGVVKKMIIQGCMAVSPLVVSISVYADERLVSHTNHQNSAVEFGQKVDPIHREKVARWMWQASSSIQRERLTSPAKSNAAYFYQKVLALEPNYQPALKGLAKLPEEYIKLAYRAYELGDYAKVQRVLNRITRVYGHTAAASERMALLSKVAETRNKETRINEARINENKVTETKVTKTKVTKTKVTKTKVTKTKVTGSTVVAGKAQVEGKTKIEASSESGQYLSDSQEDRSRPRFKQVSLRSGRGNSSGVAPPSRAEKRWMSQAQMLIEQRQWRQAENLLVRTIWNATVTDNTRLMLLEVLAKQEKWPQYQRVLLQLTEVSQATRSMLRAKMLLKIQQPQYALEELTREPPSLAADPDYHTVWALALQQTKQYETAQKKYLSLLELAPNQLKYWLGLSMAYAADGKVHDSCHAMQKVHEVSANHPDYWLNSRVVGYVKNHLARFCQPS